MKKEWESTLVWFPCPLEPCTGLIRTRVTGVVEVDLFGARFLNTTAEMDYTFYDLHMTKSHGETT